MPKAHQKRGRRMKRKHEEDPTDPDLEASPKRLKGTDIDATVAQDDLVPLEGNDNDWATSYPAGEKAFFGMLDDDEQEYFKRADEMLELNSFPTPEERALFLESVWKEADGKELKIAQSQSCSRLLERLISISTGPQLKNLFQKLSGNLIHLLSHRFASHCCETLFKYAAPHVSDEVRAPDTHTTDSNDVNDIFVSMENLFLHTIAELEGNVGFLLTDRYASHALRLLLLVLSGKPLSTDSIRGLLQSKRKEDISISGANPVRGSELDSTDRPVPQSFSLALEKLISDSVAGLDTDKLRTLATHTNANPTLQLLLSIELAHYGKQRAKDQRSIIRTLLPDDPLTPECESLAFIGGMVYDPIGSRLVEMIIEAAPSKLFKSLYHGYFKERLATYARNETGTYVVCRILERLGADDLLEAHEIVCPVIPTLLEKQWTSTICTLIDRCAIRDIDTQAIAAHIDQTFSGSNGFDIRKLLHVDVSKDVGGRDASRANGVAQADATNVVPGRADHASRSSDSTKVHFNILTQTMLKVPGSLSSLALESLIALDSETMAAMAGDHIVTRTLQQALTSKNASMIQRRKLVQHFYGRIGEMALDKSASHLVDCIWEGTHGLAFIRERIAEELAENEAALRESPSGRGVWKNWKMDIYKRRRSEWIRQSKIKASNDGFQSFSEIDAKKGNDESKKTPLQLARERHAKQKAKKQKGEHDGKRGKGDAAEPARAAASTST